MASLIPTTLLIAVVVYLVAADIPFVEPGEGCVDGISAYRVGETFNKECQTCTCEEDGTETLIFNGRCASIEVKYDL